MHHLAIMKQSWHLTRAVVEGRKVIESRWLKTRMLPWDAVHPGDLIFFKEGSFVQARAVVRGVIQLADLSPITIRHVLLRFKNELGISDANGFSKQLSEAKYAVLIWLRDVKKVRPFRVRSPRLRGGWVSMQDIAKIRA